MQALTDTLLPIVNTINGYLYPGIPSYGSRPVLQLQDEIRSGTLLWRRYETGIRKPDFKRQEA